MRFLFVLFVLFTDCSPKMSPDEKWNGKKWVLTELKGVPVQTSNTDRDAHIIFDASKKSFLGTGGCNRINGAYDLTTKGKLTFINPASTKMACDDLAFETLFLETLKSVNAWSTDDTFLYLKKDKEVLMKLK